MALRPNVTHHTGQEDHITVQLNTATAASSQATFALPFQARILSGRYSAAVAGTGAGSLIIGTSNDTSNIVTAVSISNSTNTSLTIIDQVIDAAQVVTINIGDMTDLASEGGAFTFFFETDQRTDLT